MTLLTIGYEGLDLNRFFSLLREASVETILDVRQLPLSRKKGFSKNALQAAAQERGIAYTHLSALGCPRPIRDQYKADRNWECYVARYLAYLSTQTEAVDSLAHQIENGRCCLLCFEADPYRCHRSLISAHLTKISAGTLAVQHLVSQTNPTWPGDRFLPAAAGRLSQ